MSELMDVYGADKKEWVADIVFVHGLGDTWHECWWNEDNPFSLENIWPYWIGEDLDKEGTSARVWSLAYDACPITKTGVKIGGLASRLPFIPALPVNWDGVSMPLIDTAKEASSVLEGKVGSKPIVFVAHSLGGLVVKQMIWQWNIDDRDRKRDINRNKRGVLFFATPHRGANLAKMIDNVASATGATSQLVRDLKANDSYLINLDGNFMRQYANLGLLTQVRYETQPMQIGPLSSLAVEPMSATLAPVSLDDIPVALNHIQICKFPRRDSGYASSLAFIKKCLAEEQNKSQLTGKHSDVPNNVPTIYGEVNPGINNGLAVGVNTGTINMPPVKPPRKPAFMVPFQRNQYFTGRDELLQKLHEELAKTGSAGITQAIAGLGGVGKTQTSVEYAYRYKDSYQDILWIGASDTSTLDNSIRLIANELELPEREEKESAVVREGVKRWLQQNEGWLLIVDNADDPSLVAPYLPPAPKGRILITSCDRQLKKLGVKNPLPMESLPESEAASFLLHRTDRSEIELPDATELARELGGLPLALEQAASYIEATGANFKNYLMDFKQKHLQLLEKMPPEIGDAQKTVATTWEISFQMAQKLQPAIQGVLEICAFLAPDNIPESIFRDGYTALGQELSDQLHSVSQEATGFDAMFASAERYGLISRKRELQTLSIHKLVQESLLYRVDIASQRERLERTASTLNIITPPADNFSNWVVLDSLLPHQRRCIGHLESLNIETESVSLLMNQIALHMMNRAYYSEVEHFFVKALNIAEKIFGRNHLVTGVRLNNLAELYRNQGRYGDAEPLAIRSLFIAENKLGSNYRDTGVRINNLALLYHTQGRYDEAEPLYLLALDIAKTNLGEDHPETAQYLTNLALLYQARGRYTDAERDFHSALDIALNKLGDDNPKTGEYLNNLANLYFTMKQYSDAEPLFQLASDIIIQSCGVNHISTRTILSNYFICLEKQGKLQPTLPTLSSEYQEIFSQLIAKQNAK